MVKKSYLLILSVNLFWYCSKNDPTRNPTSQTAIQGEFTLLTYNVAGLPQGISPSNPEKNIPLISPLLNKFDIALVQEDFFYHDELKSETTHAYQSEPKARASEFTSGDGLNRFSIFSFSSLRREAWTKCSNENGNDCLAQKGFSVAETEIAPGVKIDIYNMHLDAGSTQADLEARRSQIQQLLNTINSRSAGRAIIVAGDINLNIEYRPHDLPLFQTLLGEAELTDSCHFLSCANELVDRVLFRGNSSLNLQAGSWSIDSNFVDDRGIKLSDHFAVATRFTWEFK